MDTGYIKLHRKFLDDWKAENPVTLKAWIWLLINVEWSERDGLQRGQVRFSTLQAKELWGMSRTTAIRFLKRCEADGDIIWERGRGGHQDEHRSGHQMGIITLCNYGKYQGVWSLNGHQDEHQDGPSYKNKKRIRKEERSTPPIVPPFGEDESSEKKPRKKKEKIEACHDPVIIVKELENFDLEPYRAKYEPLGVNVDIAWEGFRSCALTGADRAGFDFPNPYNWTKWKGAFHTWCRNRVRQQARSPTSTATIWDGFDPERRKETKTVHDNPRI